MNYTMVTWLEKEVLVKHSEIGTLSDEQIYLHTEEFQQCFNQLLVKTHFYGQLPWQHIVYGATIIHYKHPHSLINFYIVFSYLSHPDEQQCEVLRLANHWHLIDIVTKFTQQWNRVPDLEGGKSSWKTWICMDFSDTINTMHAQYG